ncbi:MAG: hypothetical protein ACK6DQ_16325 [Planctomycetota bacterium]
MRIALVLCSVWTLSLCLLPLNLFAQDTAKSLTLRDRLAIIRALRCMEHLEWDWVVENIPFLDCPSQDIQTTYY